MASRLLRPALRAAVCAAPLISARASTAAAPLASRATLARGFAAAAAAAGAGDAFLTLDESKQTMADVVAKSPKVIAYYTAA